MSGLACPLMADNHQYCPCKGEHIRQEHLMDINIDTIELATSLNPLATSLNPINGEAMSLLEAVAYFAGEPSTHQPQLKAVAYFAGEPWTHRPQCACPVLSAFGERWGDELPDDKRTLLLRPFISRLIDTKSTPEIEEARGLLAVDWLVRTYSPVWLRAAGLGEEASKFEALPALSSVQLCSDAMPTLMDARKKARAFAHDIHEAAALAGACYTAPRCDPARAAARFDAHTRAFQALEAAAGTAARAAVWASVGGDVWASGWVVGVGIENPVQGAAANAAWEPVDAATWAPIWAVASLAPYVELLQTSAVDLFDRMINLTSIPDHKAER